MLEREMFSKRRMYNIFREDGRALIVAMDHGASLDVHPALADPGAILDAVVAGGADAILTTFGIAKNYFQHVKRAGLILRVDGGSSALPSGEKKQNILFSVENALAVGADAVACMAFPGSPDESGTLTNASRLAGECAKWSLPLMVEALPGGFADFKQHTPKNILLACRIAAELGADFIKTEYTGDKESFGQVVAGCYRPIVVLGGGKVGSNRAVLTLVRDALDAGAAGIAVGRNIWQHPNPRALVSALFQVVHEDAPVDKALEFVVNSC